MTTNNLRSTDKQRLEDTSGEETVRFINIYAPEFCEMGQEEFVHSTAEQAAKHLNPGGRTVRFVSSDTTPTSAWRPIAEAPRDGAPVLLWDDHLDPGDLDIGYWSKQLGGYWVLYGGDDAHGCGFTATHWMPLPSPPTSTKD